MQPPFPLKPTPPGGYLMLIAAGAILLLVLGLILLYLSFGQPPEKQELALTSRSVGIKTIGGSLIIGAAIWVWKRFIA